MVNQALPNVRTKNEDVKNIIEPNMVDNQKQSPITVNGFIPSERMGEFKRKIDVIQAQAHKLNLPAWDVTIGEEEWRPVRATVEDSSGRAISRTMQLEGSPVMIVGESPVLAGWKFLAKIDHGVGGNLVKAMSDGERAPAEWHSCGPNCDHCGVSRQRNNTYMLKNVETDDVKQVGSSCISDFLGEQYRDPERIAAMYDHLMEIGREFDYDPEREPGGVGLSSYGVLPERLMAATLKIIQEDGGYISAEKAESLNCLSTGDRLRAAFWSKRPIEVTPDVGNLEQAPKMVRWLKEQKGTDSLWLRNIAYLADRPGIVCKDAGLFASGYVAWNRELQRQLRSERGAGDWVGECGAKISVPAILERRGGYETQFGYKSVLSFRDEEGNALTWQTQSPPLGLVVGSNYRLMATVKGHGEYRGDKQTEIIRAKVAELELFSFGSLPGYKKLAAVATMDVADESGHTPLLKAIWSDAIDHVKVLLAAGANANQLNQGEVSMLANVASPEMAQVLLAAGARAVDVTDEWLKDMDAGARDVIMAAMPVLDSLKQEAVVNANVVSEGFHCGRVIEIADGVVIQKYNREGDTVQHDLSKLTATVQVGDVVDIKYVDGVGQVGGLAVGVDRGR